MPADLHEPAPEPGAEPGRRVRGPGCGGTSDGACGGGCGGTCGGGSDCAGGDPRPGGAEAAAAVVAEYLDPGLPRHEQLEEALDRTPTGSPLVRLLEALDPRSLDDYDLAELAAGFARMAGWVHANLAAVAVELARRPGMAPRPDPRSGRGTGITPERVAATALSARLQRSPQDTAALVREGSEFSGDLAATGQALRAGRISVPAARAIAARLADQVTWVSQPVQDYVLPRAEHSTVSQVRADLERALLDVDPEHAQDRRDAARAQRRVTHPRALPDQMAEMHVVLPAEHAVGIDTALEQAARSARAGGDPRTLDQLRADGLVDAVLTGAPPATGSDAETSPAAVPGFLPTPKDGGRARAGTTTHGGVGGGTTAHGEVGGGTTIRGGVGDRVCGDADIDAGVTRAPASASSPGSSRTAGPRDPRTHVLVTVPLSSLIGQDDTPADLAGYGPIDATTARALAQGGVWRRLVVDDLSGSVLDVGRTTYRPPAALADHVRFRDRTCTFPGCPVPAHRCDLDHSDDWSPAPDDPRPPGTTSHTNLGPACPRHHRAKHQARFDARQPEPGVHDWTDPTGHRYRTRPGTGQPTEHLTGPRRARGTPPPGGTRVPSPTTAGGQSPSTAGGPPRSASGGGLPTTAGHQPPPSTRTPPPGRGAEDDPPPF
ncbi:HNH endonuclease signature motif containing protein [Cellulomonas sp. GbtcB1]|uniref:HNH endonuclease signature motif containing protein n=1 Tax=Cellulomonas sp. GbtcB1 TaxID=2824746 RepID=UPI001C30C0EE|nr:HNH endonuclease signature motif containing protein [Cellulomonas sp. GbtcB1]